ncbi:MAG: hypothetical protein WCX97_00675 [Candidatus Magasanikbacteria bacterium]
MRKTIENIEIVEPPIQELTKKRNGFFRACLLSFFLMILIIIGIIAGLRISMGPGPKNIRSLPVNFPVDIPIYDKDNIEGITFISGKYKSRGMEIAAFFPKLILTPLLIKLDPEQNQSTSTNKKSFRDFWKILTMPVGDSRDTVQIEWRDVDTSPGFLISYYKNELKKKDFIIDSESDAKNYKQITFSRPDELSGTLYVGWLLDNKYRVSYMALTLNVKTDYTATTTKL